MIFDETIVYQFGPIFFTHDKQCLTTFWLVI